MRDKLRRYEFGQLLLVSFHSPYLIGENQARRPVVLHPLIQCFCTPLSLLSTGGPAAIRAMHKIPLKRNRGYNIGSGYLRTDRRNCVVLKTMTAGAAVIGAMIQCSLMPVYTVSGLSIPSRAPGHPSGHTSKSLSFQSSLFFGRSAVGRSSHRCSWSGGTEIQGFQRCTWSRGRVDSGELSMGIPKLFRWLTDQYPVISQRLDQGLNEVRHPA